MCSKKEDAEEGEEAPAEAAEDAPAEGKAAEPGSDCPEPIMYSMTLITANEKLDEAIAAFYTQIIQVGSLQIKFEILYFLFKQLSCDLAPVDPLSICAQMYVFGNPLNA